MSRQIGRYQVQAELGRGGFGRVFRAYDPTVGRQVAIKTLTTSDEPDMLKRFRNEASAAGKLRHPNIVVIHDFGEQDGTPYLVMELLEGEDIERIINNRRDLSLARRLDIMMKAADGLYHAHSQGIVHRDIKPANIMVLADGNVKILDFGIALLSQATAARFTPQGSVIGTLPYMAPEQLRGSVSDVSTDIFAYGVTFYRLVTGTHPFDAAEAGALMYNIINKAPAPVRQFLPQAPEALEHVVAKLLDKDRDSRYQSLEDVHFDLEPILHALRKENIGGLLAEARTLLAADRLDTAQAVVRQIIEIDPANRTARELREQLQRQMREREIRPRVASLLGSGRDELGARQFDAAIQKFESALRIDKSNPELHALLDQARAEWDRAKRADRLLDEARQALRAEDLTAAHHRIDEALSADPRNPNAPGLLETILQKLEARKQQEKLREGLSQVKTLMLSGSYTEAVRAADLLREGHPESAEAGQLRDKAVRERDAQERRRQLGVGIEAVKDSLRGRRFEQAQKRLALLSERFPDAVELHDLKSQAADGIREQKQVELVARATADTERLVAAKEFDRALSQLRSLLTENPGLSALRDLVQSVTARKTEHQRNAALADVLDKSAAHAADGRFAEVLQEIGAFVSAYGDHPGLKPLRGHAEEALERQRRTSAVRQVLLDARERIAGDPAAAIAILQKGLAQFPGDRELTALLKLADVLQKCGAHAAEGRFAEVLKEIGAFVSANGDHPALQPLRRQAEEAIEKQRRESAVRRVLVDAQKRIDAGDHAAAVTILQRGLAQFPGDRDLTALLQLAEALQTCGAHAANGRFAEVLQEIGAFVSAHGDHLALQPMRRQAEETIENQRRESAVRRVLVDAQKRIDAGDHAAAVTILQRGLTQFSGNRELAALLKLAGVLHKCGALAAKGLFADVLQEIGAFVSTHGDHPAFQPLRKQAEEAIENQHRSSTGHAAGDAPAQQYEEAAVREILLDAQKRIDAGEPVPAIAILQRGLARFQDDGELAALLETARHTQRMQEQIQAIDSPPAQRLDPRSQKHLPWTKLIAGACAAVGLTAGIAVVARRPHAPKPMDPIALEIRALPTGTKVRIGDRSCVAPDCRFQLPAGDYAVDARLDGYEPLHQTLTLRASEPARALDLTLHPIPTPPPPDNGLHATATGTVLVQAAVADAEVFVDGAARGRTDSSGSLSLTLEVKPHEIRVQHTGYKPVPTQRVEVAEGAQRNAVFNLVRESAKLELRGAPAGVTVSAGGKLLGRTNGSPTFLLPADVPAGDITIQFTASNLKLTAQRRFEPGQTLRLEWKDVAPPPPTVNAEALDNKDWEVARNSNDVGRLRDYLRVHPNGVHAKEANQRIADLAWTVVDSTNIDAVRKFARENPGNPHLSDAQKIIDQFDAEQQRLAQERARQEQAAQERARQELAAQAKKEQDRINEESRRKQGVLDALKQFDSAMQRKRVRDVKAIWPTATQLFLDSLGNSHVKMSLAPKAEDIRFLDGVDRALAECDITTTIDAAPRHQKVLLTLRHAGAAWTIEAAKFQ